MIARRRLCALLLTVAVTAPTLARADEANSKRKGGGISYIQLQTLTATVIRASGRRGVLTVEAGVDIPQASLRARANLYLPRLRAAYIQRLQLYAGGLPAATPPDPDYLARALQQETDRVLGQAGARFLLGALLVN